MPIYEFVNVDTGDKKDIFFHSSDAPSIGEEVCQDGQSYKRIPSFHLDHAGIARKTHKYPYVSKSLPRNLSGCELNSHGQPIIKSQAHERNVAAEHDMAKD